MDAANTLGGQEKMQKDGPLKKNNWAIPTKFVAYAFIISGMAALSYYAMKMFGTPEVIIPKHKEKEAVLWKIYYWLKTLF